MKNYYLIDFENVNAAGLQGCEKLTEEDLIIIFFTKNAMKINMADIANHGSARLEMMEVPAGKQSTDIHISTFIGYIVGSSPDNDYTINVISKDTDFDNIAKFWETKASIKIQRATQIDLITEEVKETAKKTVKKRKPKRHYKKRVRKTTDVVTDNSEVIEN